MKKNIFCFFVLCLLFSSNFALGTTIDFDDITTEIVGDVLLPDNYAGFEWINVGYYHKKYAEIYYPASNYPNGVHSGNYAIYNSYGHTITIKRSSTFDFLGAYFTSAWEDNNVVTLKGYSGNDLKYETNITLDLSPTRWFDLNFEGIDKLVMYSNSSDHFIMDDFNYTAPVPEPATCLMLIAGLGFVATYWRIKK